MLRKDGNPAASEETFKWMHWEDNGATTQLQDFVRWCDDRFLDLNTSETEEIIIDFRKSIVDPKPSTFHRKVVKLCAHSDSQLKFSENTDSTIRLLRKLNSLDSSRRILRTFYQAFTESLFTFSFICWFQGPSVKDRKCLNDIITVGSKITEVQ